MSSLVNRLRQAGTLHARGEFTLDVDKAGAKLSRFQFRDEREFLYHLVAGLYRLGAKSISITYAAHILKLTIDDLPIADDVPRALAASLLEELSPLRRLAAATQAVLAHQPKMFEWVGKDREQTFDYLTDASQNWSKVQLREIRLGGLPLSLMDKALTELEKQSVYNRRGLSINGRPLPTLPGRFARLGKFSGWCQCDPTRDRSELRLVVDEMCTEPLVIPADIPWCGGVYWDLPEIRMDASFASVVQDHTYQELLSAIPDTYSDCVLALLPELLRGGSLVYRDFVCDLLRPPAPAWLHKIYARLTALELFQDQRLRKWSLQALRAQAEPTYYTATRPPPDLPEIILLEKSSAALHCLHIHLPGRLLEATDVVLARLRKKDNQQRWRDRPSQGLTLPAQNWLLQKTFPSWIIGLPADWSQPGGTVTIVHEGKFLITRALYHSEITFSLVCEVDEDEVSPLWDDISEPAWSKLEPRWLYDVQELVKELADTQAELGPMQTYLIRHLARSKRPEESYFAKTLLFRDWLGIRYSLFSLLTAQGEGHKIGYVNSQESPDPYPPEFLPPAIFIQAAAHEIQCLTHVKGLAAIDFNLLLEDLRLAQRTPPMVALNGPGAVAWEDDNCTGCLEITPEYGQAIVHPFVNGVALTPERISSQLGFVAHIHSQQFKVRIRLDNQRLGPDRFVLASNAAWKQCLDSLSEQSQRSLQQRLKSMEYVVGEWLTWARRGILAGLALEQPALAKVACWSATPQAVSLDQMLAAATLYWSSQNLDSEPRREFVAQHPGMAAGQELLFAPLINAEQQQLEKRYGGKWSCVDSWFAQQARLKEFLRRIPAQLGYAKSLDSAQPKAPLVGLISLRDLADQPGAIEWLYRGRYVKREGQPQLPGLWAQIESDGLEINEQFTDLGPPGQLAEIRQQVVEQMVSLLASYLSQPRPNQSHLAQRWPEWDALRGDVSLGLRQQPWIRTNHGIQSWQELMQVPKLYRLPAGRPGIPTDLTVVIENSNPGRLIDMLMGRHTGPVTVKATQKLLEDRQRLEQQQTLLRAQAQRLKDHPYKIDLEPPQAGEIAWKGKLQKDCWLVVQNRVLLIHNLPSGWMGYVQTDDYKLRKVAAEEQAELSLQARKQLYLALLPLVLKRISAGQLRAGELDGLAEYCLAALSQTNPQSPDDPWNGLAEARWIACADGTRVSLQQLRLEGQEKKQLCYWEKTYPLARSAGDLTPLLSTPLLKEVVTRWCGVPLVMRQKPLLYRDVTELAAPKLNNIRELLEGVGRWVRERPGACLQLGLHKVMKEFQQLQDRQLRAQEKLREKTQQAHLHASTSRDERQQEVDQQGKTLLTALRRQSSLLLEGMARRETLRYLERATWSQQKSSLLWVVTPDGRLTLHAQHPQLRPWLGASEPPAQVTLSLLLGLVSAINARSEPFTDAMERDFLERLIGEMVETYRDVMPE